MFPIILWNDAAATLCLIKSWTNLDSITHLLLDREALSWLTLLALTFIPTAPLLPQWKGGNPFPPPFS